MKEIILTWQDYHDIVCSDNTEEEGHRLINEFSGVVQNKVAHKSVQHLGNQYEHSILYPRFGQQRTERSLDEILGFLSVLRCMRPGERFAGEVITLIGNSHEDRNWMQYPTLFETLLGQECKADSRSRELTHAWQRYLFGWDLVKDDNRF